MDIETQDELAFFAFMDAREAALQGAVGQIVTDNVPTERVRQIAETSRNEIISLAARIVLWQRRETTPRG